MSFAATVYSVMIASPGDVQEERRAAKEAIHKWNAVNSEDRGMVLLPACWETHASPSMEGRAQETINRQVLANCDLLVAVFWTRIGSPTGKAVSGTVEEIEEHLKTGKPAMIYFSSAPVRPDNIDENQYAALKGSRKRCRERGLVEMYDSLADFRDKFSRQLAMTVIRHWSSNEQPQAEPAPGSEEPDLPQLGDAAKQILIEASEDRHGRILMTPTMAGLHIATSRKSRTVKHGRVEASLRAAIRELCEQELLEERGDEGETFSVTDRGYEVADALKQQWDFRGQDGVVFQ